MTQKLTVIILTKDEALHIRRAIASVAGFADRVIVVDSGSTDNTVALARAVGAEVLYHPWTNHAAQFNWALDRIKGTGGWVLRLDADEIATPALGAFVRKGLPAVDGIKLTRHIRFEGQQVRFGGVGKRLTLRLFREGTARAEARWMDEHIVVGGPVISTDAAIIDDNCRPLGWWIDKHNRYADAEVLDILSQRYCSDDKGLQQKGALRWLKTHAYGRMPLGLRAAAYFFFRFVLLGGMFDAPAARRFHVLQGFWYRYLVDAKLAAAERAIAASPLPPAKVVAAMIGRPAAQIVDRAA